LADIHKEIVEEHLLQMAKEYKAPCPPRGEIRTEVSLSLEKSFNNR